nr:apolipoprotein N-acyltransferase [uncultured Desulfuromonas sp.]
MNNRWLQRVAPPLSGLLMALAFPLAGQGWLAWLALVPLFVVMPSRPWRSGFSAGVVFFAVTLYWLNLVMTVYGQLPWLLSIVAYLLLAAYLALFWAATCWCSVRIQHALHVPLPLVMAVCWVALEYVRNWLLTGFPWGNIGYSQIDCLWVVQSADLFGVYGLVAMLVAVNALIADVIRRSMAGHAWPWRSVGVVGLLLLGQLGYGHWRVAKTGPGQEAFRVGLVQGSIDQAVKWNPTHLQHTLDRYLQLSNQAQDPDLLVWPESATPFFYQNGGTRAYQVRSVPRDQHAYLLFGSPSYVRQQDHDEIAYLNSAYLLSPQAQLLGRSDKVHLVPFGEYVPLWGMFGLVEKLAEGIGDFVPGQLQPLSMNGHQLGVLICYEAIFPELAQKLVARGAQVLVNITNDAWFGDSSAPWQHLDMARMRAVENNVWLLRSANTGVSALIDPCGRVVAQSRLFEPALVEGTAYFQQGGSLYTRTGDSLPRLLGIVVLVWLWQSRKKKL